jgi:hypothetical protein
MNNVRGPVLRLYRSIIFRWRAIYFAQCIMTGPTRCRRLPPVGARTAKGCGARRCSAGRSSAVRVMPVTAHLGRSLATCSFRAAIGAAPGAASGVPYLTLKVTATADGTGGARGRAAPPPESTGVRDVATAPLRAVASAAARAGAVDRAPGRAFLGDGRDGMPIATAPLRAVASAAARAGAVDRAPERAFMGDGRDGMPRASYR